MGVNKLFGGSKKIIRRESPVKFLVFADIACTPRAVHELPFTIDLDGIPGVVRFRADAPADGVLIPLCIAADLHHVQAARAGHRLKQAGVTIADGFPLFESGLSISAREVT